MIEHIGLPQPTSDLESQAMPRAMSDKVLAKILVVDDDPRNLIAVEEVLRSPGIEIVTADCGEARMTCMSSGAIRRAP
jgi:response regulator RpfG family c-di-GMP phosphodiesterase